MCCICRVLEQIRWGELKVSELKPAFYLELTSSNHILSNFMAISLQLRVCAGQSNNVSCIERVKWAAFHTNNLGKN